jgi:SET domain-containing protein
VPFRRNQQIAEYVGERISMAEAVRRRRAAGERCICDIDGQWAIDGSRGGNGTQYINHSCQPNAHVIISRGRIFLYALRDIAPGEEITTDYLYELRLEKAKCRCGTSSCVKGDLPGPIVTEESTSHPPGKEGAEIGRM